MNALEIIGTIIGGALLLTLLYIVIGILLSIRKLK